MRKIHRFLAYLLIACILYIVTYEAYFLNISLFKLQTVWDYLYMYAYAQSFAAMFYLVYTGILLYKYKLDFEMVEFFKQRKKLK